MSTSPITNIALLGLPTTHVPKHCVSTCLLNTPRKVTQPLPWAASSNPWLPLVTIFLLISNPCPPLCNMKPFSLFLSLAAWKWYRIILTSRLLKLSSETQNVVVFQIYLCPQLFLSLSDPAARQLLCGVLSGAFKVGSHKQLIPSCHVGFGSLPSCSLPRQSRFLLGFLFGFFLSSWRVYS